MEQISGRRAGQMLAEIGIRRETARHLLNAGVAGQALVTSAAHFYDADRVRAVVDRAGILDGWTDAAATEMFVGRIGPRSPDPGPGRTWRGADVSAPIREQLDAVSQPWALSPWKRVLLRSLIERDGFVPFLGALGGVVVVGGEIVGLGRAVTDTAGQPRGTAFDLREARDWFSEWQGRRLQLGDGGPWRIIGPPDSRFVSANLRAGRGSPEPIGIQGRFTPTTGAA
jgi:hypothetical protein